MADLKEMGGGDGLPRSSSPGFKAKGSGEGLPRPSSPELKAAGGDLETSSTDLRAAGGDPAPTSPDLRAAGGDPAPSLPDLRAAGGDPAPSLPHLRAAGGDQYGLEGVSWSDLKAIGVGGLPWLFSMDLKTAGGEVLPDSKTTGGDPHRGKGLSRPCLPDSRATGGDPHSGEGTLAYQQRMAVHDLFPVEVSGDQATSLVGSFSEAGLPDTIQQHMAMQTHTTPIERWAESDELDMEYEDDEYYMDFVDRFIAAAYPPGMNEAVATGPEQQEAVTTPGASSRGMETWAAREVAELEGSTAVVSTGCGVRSASPVADTVSFRMVTRERFTWKHQTTEDGPNGLTVLSPVKTQPPNDKCMPTAAATVMEPNLRVQHNKDTLLSVDHLILLADAAKKKYPNVYRMVALFMMIQAEGVLSEDDYSFLQTATARAALRYYITEYKYYNVADSDNMRHALYKLRSKGPLMGVIKISPNYDDCYASGHIYKYDPNLKDEEGKLMNITHAVCIISFAIEESPFLECQNTHGETFSNKGFLKIDVTSLCHLWSVVVR